MFHSFFFVYNNCNIMAKHTKYYYLRFKFPGAINVYFFVNININIINININF